MRVFIASTFQFYLTEMDFGKNTNLHPNAVTYQNTACPFPSCQARGQKLLWGHPGLQEFVGQAQTWGNNFLARSVNPLLLLPAGSLRKPSSNLFSNKTTIIT
jgi:hypothetical protein